MVSRVAMIASSSEGVMLYPRSAMPRTRPARYEIETLYPWHDDCEAGSLGVGCIFVDRRYSQGYGSFTEEKEVVPYQTTMHKRLVLD